MFKRKIVTELKIADPILVSKNFPYGSWGYRRPHFLVQKNSGFFETDKGIEGLSQ